jgi:hypothetical protein
MMVMEQRNRRGHATCAGILMLTLVMVEQGYGGLWQCTQSDGTVLFKDGGGPGCRELGASSELQSTRFPNQSGSVDQSSKAKPPILPAQTDEEVLSSRSFAPASRTVPALSYRDLAPELRAKGWSIPNKGDIQLLQVDVSHLPAGNGPSIATDHHFMDEARQALGVAVLAAAKAVHYDARFLQVQLTMPMVAGSFNSGKRVDGASASAAWAVAVTSAILGDALRPDVCFSGTIDLTLAVGPVGGLEHKIEGCRLLPQFQELLLPAGQRTFAITDKGMARSIKVTEASTLSEAYEVFTGQPLRAAP